MAAPGLSQGPTNLVQPPQLGGQASPLQNRAPMMSNITGEKVRALVMVRRSFCSSPNWPDVFPAGERPAQQWLHGRNLSRAGQDYEVPRGMSATTT